MTKITTNIFIEKAKKTHEDKYDYSNVIYKNNKTKVKIICKEHGLFLQTPTGHLFGYGCQKCGRIKSSNVQRMSLEEFKNNSNNKHSFFYDYSLIDFTDLNNNVKIKCPIHGIFHQRGNRHLNGSICPKCNNIKSANSQKNSKEQFIEKSKEVHGNQFDYSKVVYINNKTKVEIICSKHGSWWQTPVNHINNKRKCPLCNESKGEEAISIFLKANKINFERQKTFIDCKDIRKLPFDFYIPKQNLCIEFNGIQHYKSIEYFGGIQTTKSQQKRDKIKEVFCLKNNINLLVIKYTDNIENVLKTYLSL